MGLIRIVLARILFGLLIKLIEAEERALGLPSLKQEREL
jgi:hypothetical protein